MGIFDRLRQDTNIMLTSPLLGSTGEARLESAADHESGMRISSSMEEASISSRSLAKRPRILFIRSRLLITACLTFLLLLLLISLPSNIDASRFKDLHTDFIAKWNQATSSSSSSLSTSSGLDRSWDYYAQNGIFVQARNDGSIPQNRRARFIPVDQIQQLAENNQTGLEGELKLGDGFDELGRYVQAVNHKRQAAIDDLAYLKNKTVLLIGDSIDRFSLDFTCRSIFSGSSLSYRELHHEPNDLSQITRPDNGVDEFSEPHKCELNKDLFPNTSIWSLMVYGVTSEEEEWSHKGQCLHPRKYDSKIKLFHERFSGEPVQEGTEQEVGKGGLGIQPDLIIVNTVLWDLATANLRDAKAEVTAKEQLDWKFLEEFRTKTIDLMRLIDKLWPNAAKMYRPNHAMRHGSDGVWFLHGLNPMPKSISRAPYMPNKVLQLNQIIDDLLANQSLYLEDHEADEDERSEKRAKSSATPRKPWWPFDIRHAMQEYVADFQDGVHTGGSGRTIYAQMLAYYIKMLT